MRPIFSTTITIIVTSVLVVIGLVVYAVRVRHDVIMAFAGNPDVPWQQRIVAQEGSDQVVLISREVPSFRGPNRTWLRAHVVSSFEA
jgi:hypothetical protein